MSFVDAFGGITTESRSAVSFLPANEGPAQQADTGLSAVHQPADTVRIDTTGVLPYDFEDEPEFAFPDKKDSAKLYLKKPSNIRTEIEYDPVSGEYIFTEKVGDLNFRLPKTMTRKEFQQYDFEQSVQNYWRNQTQIKALEDKGGLIPKLTIGGRPSAKSLAAIPSISGPRGLWKSALATR